MSTVASAHRDDERQLDSNHPLERVRKSLRGMYRNPFGKLILGYFATLNRTDTVVKVEDLENLPLLDRTEIIEQLRRLTDPMNLGKFKTGRKGYSSRFESYYNLKEIGQFAMRLSQAQESLQRKAGEVTLDVNEDQEVEEPGSLSDEMPCLEHRFMLRPNYLVNIRLPKDLTDSEALRLSDFVKALPFH